MTAVLIKVVLLTLKLQGFMDIGVGLSVTGLVRQPL